MDDAFESKLAAVLERCIDGYRALESVERLSGGANQETYRVVARTGAGERRLALRRAAGGHVHAADDPTPGLAVEAEMMRLAREAGVPEPEIHAVLGERDGLGDGILMEWLDGETLGARIARSEALAAIRPHLARQCGEILARIHAIDVDAAGLRERLELRDPETTVRQTWERYQAYGTPQPMIDYAARWLLEHLPTTRRETLVHGDFRNGNLMVTPDAGITAVLDWEGAHIGDPIKDLGWVCTNSWRFGVTELPVGGFGEIEDLLDGYASVAGERPSLEELRFWTVFGSFSWAVGCLSMAEHYRTGPDPSVERPAIGRRTSECQIDCVNLLIPGPVNLVEPDTDRPSTDMPRTDELVGSVRDFLRETVMAETDGRTRFLARVAGNSLDIVLRELELRPRAREREREALERLLGEAGGEPDGGPGDVEILRVSLVERLRDRAIALDAPGLAEYLRDAVANQVAIDQPRYSGLATALSGETDKGFGPA